MLHEVIMPVLGMSQDSGAIYKWHKNVGDPIAAGEILMEVETDKAVMEIEARNSGILKEIISDPGIEVPVGDVVAISRPSRPRYLEAPRFRISVIFSHQAWLEIG